MSTTNPSGIICVVYAKSGTCQFGSRCNFSHVDSVNGSSSSSSMQSSKQPRERTKQRRKPKPAGKIDSFFARYPDFGHNPSAPIWTEFNRMVDVFGWDDDDNEMKEARREFKSAMVQEFNDLYGADAEDLSSWQNLCRILYINPVPKVLEDCRKRIRQRHVNLVDLVDAPRTREAVRVFPTLKELRIYTVGTKKYFPKEDAYAGGLLRFLLREILHSKKSRPGWPIYGGED